MQRPNSPENRPPVPKRVVITGGMPYGNKDLHFGHIGGMFVQADAFARFMRDRIGKENVLFVSGTDCYGSPIVESHRQQLESGQFQGSIEEFVKHYHTRQSEVLNAFGISMNLFSASGFGRSSEIHREMCGNFFKTLHNNGHLLKLSSSQFFDKKVGAMLNGRQVLGRCPIPGCASEKAYADECSLGHPYEPKDLIEPKSVLSGETPELTSVENWYIDLCKFHKELSQYATTVSTRPWARPYVVSGMREFLELPAIYVKADNETLLAEATPLLPTHERKEQAKNQPIKLVFENLQIRSKASEELSRRSIRFREGKTLVPFRLTGNVEWGVPSPELQGLKNATFWVWPESLWAPLSFTATWLEQNGQAATDWKRWWCSSESQVFQFIGEDNLYFYSLAEMSLLMGMQGKEASATPAEGQLQLPELVVNNHILFFDKKASSSGNIKPPMARELLEHYTPDQIRAHFLALGLGMKSVGFKPKPFNPQASDKEGDPVLKEGNLLCNAFNKAARTCFYTLQKCYDCVLPTGNVSPEIMLEAEKVILDFERAMLKHTFHECMAILDNYTRSINKYWTSKVKPGADLDANDETLKQALLDTLHMVRLATVLFHPIAPFGTEMIREYMNMGEDFWSWERIFDPITAFIPDSSNHKFKVLEPRIDFFPKHASQF
jgi:methionyl-tRNA synthetase